MRQSLLLAVCSVLQVAAPLAAQATLANVPAQELYAKAKERAAKVTDQCTRSSGENYLEALTYMFAYYQVASRDGSLQTAPDFDRTFKERYATVLRVGRKCLGLEFNASASMRDDGTGFRVAPPPPVNQVDLPNPPPAGAGVIATDDQGRTIPQLRAIVDQFPQERAMYRAEITRVEQQRDALAAEVARLRTPAPPPPPAVRNLNGEWSIQVVANNLLWHDDGNGDNRVSTRYQPNDAFTRFILEQQPDGSYRIRVKANNRYLHAPGHEDWTLNTIAQVDDDYTRFFIVPEADGTTFRLRQKATGRYLGQRPDGIITNNPLLDDNFMRFRLLR